MKLFMANISDVREGDISRIAPERAEKARRYCKPADQKRCIAGGLLLRRFLGDTRIFENEFGKPVAENGVCFNLSHSGDWVLLAVSDREVGCDIEQLRQVDPIRLGKAVFTENELTQIQNSADRQGAFFTLWTKKEALLKCMGKGFHRAAKTVDVTANFFAEDGRIYRMKTVHFADYVVSVCEQDGETEIDLQFFRLKSLT